MEELRRIAGSLPAPPSELDAYLEKVRTRAYAITDAEVAALPVDEDVVFEQTVGVAIREGLRRYDAAERVL